MATYDHLGNARAVYLLHVEDVAVQDDLVADLGWAAQMPEDEATDGVEVFARKVGVKSLVDGLDRDAAVYRVGAILQLAYHRLLLVELVPNLTDDLLQDVLDGEEPLERSPLVDDY